jgi:FHS family L-fucose permease-like MFS transporter
MSNTVQSNTLDKRNYIISLTTIGVFFFIFGAVTWLNAVLIPYLKIACQLTSDFEALLVAFAFYIAYVLMAVPSSYVLRKTGFKRGMSLGLLVMSFGALIFIPAALTRTYGLFLTGLFVMGTGLALLQTAVNPYVTILGPIESAAKRISIMGICNKMAGVIAPLMLGAIILEDINPFVESLKPMDVISKAAALDSLAHRAIIPYLVIFGMLVILAILLQYTSLPDIDTEHENETVAAANANKTSVFQFPQLTLGVITLFFYVGVEVIAADTIIRYGNSQGIPLGSARLLASYTLLSMVIGYILGIILIPKYIKQGTALGISAILGFVFSITAIFTSTMNVQTYFHLPFIETALPFDLSVAFIALLGLANAIMWPAIWPLAIEGLGRFTKIASSLLIMAIAGGALMPLLFGILAGAYGFSQAYWICVPSYLLIFYYAFFGHKLR